MREFGELRGARLPAFAFAVLTSLALAASASAQTVGKVEGTVTDRDTGEPLPGTQVIIQGTQLGNISDDNGYYFINNVPAGAQTVEASFLGFQTEAQEHRILAGQTTTVDFALSTEVIVADSAIVTVTERTPLVPRDNTISKSRFLKENVQDLPLTSVNDLVTLAAGASEQQAGISLRGARPDDATVYVDGLNATDFANISAQSVGRPQAGGEKSPLSFGQFSIEQLDVVTGGADASFGDAQSGVINVVTGRGGAAVSGSLRFTTDAMNIERTDDFYQLQGNVGGPVLPGGKASFFLSGTITGQRLTSDSYGFDPRFEDVVEVGRRFDLDISEAEFCEARNCEELPVGDPRRIPVRGGPLLPDGGTVVKDPLPVLDIENFVADYLSDCGVSLPCPEGFLEDNQFYFNDGDTDVYPGEFADNYAVAGKLAFTPGARTDIQLSYTRNRDQGNFDTLFPFNPFNNRVFKETADFVVGSWRQIFYQEAERSLAVEGRVGYFDDRYTEGAPFSLVDSVGGFPLLDGNQGGDDFLNFRFSDYEIFNEDKVDDVVNDFEGGALPNQLGTSNAWADIEAIRGALTLGELIPDVPTTRGGGPDIFGIGATGTLRNVLMPLAIVGKPRGSLRDVDRITNNREQRLNVRGDVDAQISRIDRLQGGVDLKFFDVQKLSIGQVNRLFSTAYFVEPRLFGIYATNRIDLGDFVLDLGGRVDHFDHNSDLAEDPGVARRDVDGNCLDVPGAVVGSAECTLTEYDTKTAFGPRLGVAHPVTENTQVRFSYGVFNQLPGLDELYQHVSSDIQAGDLNDNAIVGNPDLDFQQTRSFELGITHLLTEDLVLDLVAYNRDIDKGTAARNINHPAAGSLRKLFNVNNGTVRGLDLTMTKRFSNYWSADVTYSYLDSKVTDSDQDQFTFNRGFDSTSDNPIDAPATPLPADFDVTHKLASTFSLRFPRDFAEGSPVGALFQNFGVFATARFSSGLPYTRQPVASGIFIEPPNSSRRDSEFTTDVRATKYFEIASDVELGAIFEVFNLFNNENLGTAQDIPFGASAVNNGVYGSTGLRELNADEPRRAADQATEDVLLSDLDADTLDQGGRLTREFREFTDINGDGVVTREEQRIMGTLAIGAANEITAQPKRSYRLGVELRF